MKLDKIIYYANVPYHLANHLIGEHHTQGHRRAFGVIVMFFGVYIAHLSAHLPNIFFSLFGDLVGYSIHGTGLIPILHDVENAIKKQPPSEQPENQNNKPK